MNSTTAPATCPSREEREGWDVSRANDREVMAVDSRDLGDAQALGRGDDRRIDRAQWQVAVARDEFGDPEPIHDRHGFDVECSTRDVAEEADLGFCTEASRKEVDDLGDDQRGDDEWAGMSLEEVEGNLVVGVVGVDVGVQRSGVDDQRGYRATSPARISSMRSDTSLRPLWPAPAAPS